MRVGLITLGCDKNTVDNEYLAGLLESGGCEAIAVDDFSGEISLDAIVVATCGFIGDAKEQSVQAIVSLAEMKRLTGNPRRLYVAGCLAQRYAAELRREIPEIDGIVGVGQFAEMAAMIQSEEAPACLVRETPRVEINGSLSRKRLDTKPYAYLKIADGCNHRCAFCAIPAMKGPYRSVPPEALIEEARALLAQGVRELNLIAQDITAYGLDRGDCRLPELIRRLALLEGDFWIRCLYAYPGGITNELIETMASIPKVVHYLDMPVQHLDPGVLRRMNRPAWDLDIGGLLGRLRAAMPDISLRTTVLVGFPGETASAHRRLLENLRQHSFHWAGVFSYSREEGTAADAMPRHPAKRTREKRRQDVLDLQSAISAQYNETRIGTHTRVLLESFDATQGLWMARSPSEAPEVDGCVFVAPAGAMASGRFIEVEIRQASGFDVFAEAVQEP